MPALNFMAEFASMIEDGDKRQTIRAPRRDGRPHARVGDTIKLYTGMRRPGCRLLREARVVMVKPVVIRSTDMDLGDRRLQAGSGNQYSDPDEFDNDFARIDGFDSFTAMAEWFDSVHGLPFEGVAIRWTND